MVRGTFLRALHLFRAKMFKHHNKQQLSLSFVVVGEREAAFYVMEYEKVDLVVYHVLTKMNHNDVASIGFTTTRSVKEFDIDDLTSIVNAIVYCTNPLDDA